jgi:sulfur carrier protein
MTVTINGKEEHVREGQSLLAFLTEKGLDPKTLVVEHNGEILKAENLSQIKFQSGDRIEIIRFVGGG